MKNKCSEKYKANKYKKNKNMKIIKSSLIVTFFWILALFPFAFISISLLFYSNYKAILKLIISTATFIGTWCILIGIISIILTLLNNWQIKRKAHSKFIYNRDAMNRKEQILKIYFTKKYGNDLHLKKSYVIDVDNNIPLNKFMKLYLDEGVDKRDGY